MVAIGKWLCKASICWGSSLVVLGFPMIHPEEIEGYGNVGTNLLAFAKTVMKELPSSILLVTTGLRSLLQTLWSKLWGGSPEKITCPPFWRMLTDKNHQFQIVLMGNIPSKNPINLEYRKHSNWWLRCSSTCMLVSRFLLRVCTTTEVRPVQQHPDVHRCQRVGPAR